MLGSRQKAVREGEGGGGVGVGEGVKVYFPTCTIEVEMVSPALLTLGLLSSASC